MLDTGFANADLDRRTCPNVLQTEKLDCNSELCKVGEYHTCEAMGQAWEWELHAGLPQESAEAVRVSLERCLTATAERSLITQTCEGLKPPAARDLYDSRAARASGHALKKVRCRSRQNRMPPTVKKNTLRKERGARATHSRGHQPNEATESSGLRLNMHVSGHGASMGLGATCQPLQESAEARA